MSEATADASINMHEVLFGSLSNIAARRIAELEGLRRLVRCRLGKNAIILQGRQGPGGLEGLKFVTEKFNGELMKDKTPCK